MAKYNKKGALTGLVGNIVAYESMGENRLRTRAASRSDTSPKIFEARKNFTYIIQIMKKIKPLIDIGFKTTIKNRSAYHCGLSANLNSYLEALRLEAADNFGWICLSEGKVSRATEITASVTDDEYITVWWNGTEKGRVGKTNDLVYAGAFRRETQSFIVSQVEALRKDGIMRFKIGKLMAGEKIDLFLFFQDKKTLRCSNSQWMVMSDELICSSFSDER